MKTRTISVITDKHESLSESISSSNEDDEDWECDSFICNCDTERCECDLHSEKSTLPEMDEIDQEFLNRLPENYRESYIKNKKSLHEMKHNNTLEYMKYKQYIDLFERIPFGKYSELPFQKLTGHSEKCEFLDKTRKHLDDKIYGHLSTKKELVKLIAKWMATNRNSGCVIGLHGSPGIGKCFGRNTPILMYDGSIKMVQDIIVGEQLMGDDSTPRNVLSLGSGRDTMYSVKNTKGLEYVVNSEHILSLIQTHKKNIRDRESRQSFIVRWFDNNKIRTLTKTFSYKNKNKEFVYNIALAFKDSLDENLKIDIPIKDYLKLTNHMQKTLKGYQVPVSFPERKQSFDPYIIGVWLGDGTSSDTGFTNKDSTILHYLEKELQKYKCYLQYNGGSRTTNKNPFAFRINGINNGKGQNKFLNELKKQNLLNNKHIPVIYKINSRENRLKLLAGILDTDGSLDIKGNCYDLVQKNGRLMDDIIYLCRSLGFACYKTECKKGCDYNGEYREGTYYRISISGNGLEEIPILCSRKKASCRKRVKNVLVSGITIKKLDEDNYYGFTLDDNHRFVMGNFIVSHNTKLLKEVFGPILERPVYYTSLAGISDGGFLDGYDYCYEGSSCGRIIDAVIRSNCMNPIIFFDELDKVSKTKIGAEIIGKLINITDPMQNSALMDKYFKGINFDLSKAMFVFSFNDSSQIDPILLNRIKVINVPNYDYSDKVVIMNKFLLPSICDEYAIDPSNIQFSQGAIKMIIGQSEDPGVRYIQRVLETVIGNLNVVRYSSKCKIDFTKTIKINEETLLKLL
jgi:hypothetical protein